MWMTSATAHSSAPPDQVWQMYTEVAHWSQWDRGTQQSSIDGPFTVGTRGTLHPAGGPALPFEIIWAVAGQGFADQTLVGPDTTLILRHVLTPSNDGTQITHSIELSGPAADEMAAMMGTPLAEGLRAAVAALARYAAEAAHG